VIRKKRPFFGRKASVIFSNILNREFTAVVAKSKLVTDITYVRIGHDFVYLSVILDLFNNEVLACQLSTRNDLQLVIDTVKQLDAQEALLHSNQGFQKRMPNY